MKRLFSALLCAALLFSLPVTAFADEGDPTEQETGEPEVHLRTSVYVPCASMSENRASFRQIEELFPLSAPLNRAMAAYILAGYEGIEAAAVQPVCSDIDAAAWYAAGANWAVRSGVLPAADGGLFRPDAEMDREELCLTLQRYLVYSQRSLEEINPWYSFMDAGTMSADGRQAAAVMQQAGVLIEEDDGFFYPSQTVSLGEAESIFLRFFGCFHGPAYSTVPISTVIESAAVDKTWFDDACFIGHSQVVGIANYLELRNADYYCCVGFTAQDLLNFPYYQGPDNRYGTVNKIFHNFPDIYNKVYIMLGINDCNVRDTRIAEFEKPMRELLDIVTETQPNATIYLISLAPVGRETPLNKAYNPENTTLYSQAIKDLSREYDTEYLDVFRLLADNEGYFLDIYGAGDGIHIKPKQYPVIEDFLRCHTGS